MADLRGARVPIIHNYEGVSMFTLGSRDFPEDHEWFILGLSA